MRTDCILKSRPVQLIMYAVLKSPGIKFPIPQESKLVPKVIGTELLIKVLGHARTMVSIFLPDTRFTPRGCSMHPGHACCSTGTDSGNFKMGCIQGGEKKIKKEARKELVMRQFRNICPELRNKKRTPSVLPFLCCLGNWMSHY